MRPLTTKLAAAAAALTVGLTLGFGGTAAAKELKLSYFMSPKHPMNAAVFTPFAERLEALSGGQLTVKQFPAGELGKGPQQQYKRALDGVADIVFGIPGYTQTLFQGSMMVAIPGVVPDAVTGTEMLYAAVEYIDPEYHAVERLAMWTNEIAVLITRDKPVRAIADVKGMKIRAPSAADAPFIKAWGAVPVQMPITETYNALGTGIIDAILVGSSAIGSFKLFEPAKYITTNMPASSAAFYLVMNKQSLAALSPQEQAWVRQAGGVELGRRGGAGYEAAGKRGLALAAKNGIEIIDLSDGARAQFEAAAAPERERVLDEVESNGVPAREIIAAMRSVLTN